ncbi:MAG: carbohydrate-binding domain-containing protein [Lachnospiraceae bacterium]
MKRRIVARLLATTIAASVIFVGCGNTAAKSSSQAAASTQTSSVAAANDVSSSSKISPSEAASQDASAAGTTEESTANSAQTTKLSTSASESEIFTDRDLCQSADLSGAETITVTDGQDVSITKEGVYVITGTAKNCTIRVDVTDSEKVQLVLDNASITNDSAPAIYVVNADKVFVTTAEGSENTLEVTGTFTADGETNTDAVIFSKDDLVLNGLGTLTIHSTDNGISAKDDFKVTGGTYIIEAVADAVEANDSISICDGDFTITGQKDGLHCENDDDNTEGSIYISGGNFDIDVKSDAIQATTTLVLDGGTFHLVGKECLEATNITINDGTVKIEATDDGINASKKSTAVDVVVTINGGDITIDMGAGDTDAIDANGSLYINGGTLNITAQSPFDYDNEGKLSESADVTVNGEKVTELTSQFGGGFGGGKFGGFGPRGGNDGNGSEGTRPERPEGGFGGGSGRRGRSGDQSQDGSTDGQFPDFPEGFDGQTPPEGFDGQFPGNFNKDNSSSEQDKAADGDLV